MDCSAGMVWFGQKLTALRRQRAGVGDVNVKFITAEVL